MPAGEAAGAPPPSAGVAGQTPILGAPGGRLRPWPPPSRGRQCVQKGFLQRLSVSFSRLCFGLCRRAWDSSCQDPGRRFTHLPGTKPLAKGRFYSHLQTGQNQPGSPHGPGTNTMRFGAESRGRTYRYFRFSRSSNAAPGMLRIWLLFSSLRRGEGSGG